MTTATIWIQTFFGGGGVVRSRPTAVRLAPREDQSSGKLFKNWFILSLVLQTTRGHELINNWIQAQLYQEL